MTDIINSRRNTQREFFIGCLCYDIRTTFQRRRNDGATRYALRQRKQEMLVDILTSHVAKTEEAGKEGDDLMTGKARSANKLIEGLLFLQNIKQQLDVVVIGQDGTLGLL